MAENNDFNYIFKFTWVIDNISLCPWNYFSIDSPEYTVQNMDGSQWYINLCSGCNKHILCILCRSKSDSAAESIEVEFKIEMENSKNKRKIIEKKKCLFNRGYSKGFQTPFLMNDIFNNKSSVTDSWTIRCFMTSEAYKNAKSAECFARTKFPYDRTCFKWTLCGLDCKTFSASKRFHYLEKNPMFEIKIETSTSENDFTIFIDKLSDFEDFGALICRFTILNTSEADEISQRYIGWFKNSKRMEFPKFLKNSILKSKKLFDLNGNFELLCDFYITRGRSLSEIIYCKIDDLKPDQHLFNEAEQLNSDSGQRVFNDVEQINNSHFSTENFHIRALIEDYSAMLNNNTKPDVILKIGEEEFPGHTCVLSTRSPVFKVMFEQDMSEKNAGLVLSQDLNSETIKTFLEYLYTGAIKDIDTDLVHKLLLVAEKYQVEPLKKLCADFLLPALTVKNVCDYLLTADMVSEQTLKTAAINFIIDHFTEVVTSPEWLNCAERNFALTLEVMRIVHSLPEQT